MYNQPIPIFFQKILHTGDGRLLVCVDSNTNNKEVFFRRPWHPSWRPPPKKILLILSTAPFNQNFLRPQEEAVLQWHGTTNRQTDTDRHGVLFNLVKIG